MVVSTKTPNAKVNNNVNGNNIFPNSARRSPLLRSEAENGPNTKLRRPKSREVTSRFLSSSTSVSSTTSTSTTSSSSISSNSMTSRRSASPMVARTVTGTTATATTPLVHNSNRRAQSAERRRPGTPKDVQGEMSTAAKLLMTSTRSLSVSFQGQSLSMPVSKARPAASAGGLSGVRRGTPERRKPTPGRDQRENLNVKPSDQQRWPARSRPGNSSFLTRSLDFGAPAADKARMSGSASVVKAMQQSVIHGNPKHKNESKLETKIKNFELEKKIELVTDANSAISATADSVTSDSDSVSSGSTTGVQGYGSVRGGPRGIIVPARFWQEINNKVRRGSEPGSPDLKDNGSKFMGTAKLITARKYFNDSPVSSPRLVSASRGFSSPLRGGVRPASPSKVLTSATNSPLRGMHSPIRMRNGMASMANNSVCSTPSILSFAADVRRGKMGENRIVDAHELRLLYNRHLQWRFVNARAESALMVQTEVAERSLYNAWVTALKLRHSVKSKRMQLQLLSQNLKLYSILKRQVPYLENWDIVEKDHCNSLLGAIEALEASTVRLPVVSGARADIQEVKNALCSAVDVMQMLASSICSLLTKVEQATALISELASMTTNEHSLLYECKDLFSQLTAMEVNDCSLRVHVLQLKRLPPSLTTDV